VSWGVVSLPPPPACVCPKETADLTLSKTVAAPNADFTGSDVTLSRSGRYLWATSRARNVASVTGYVAGFLLDDDGVVLKQIFMHPTASFGSVSNAVTAAPWSDEYFLVTDTPGGYVEVWKVDGREETELGVEYSSARAVARVDVGRGCCANALWVN
jgi:carboxy-cis,cis-muconate cyclase